MARETTLKTMGLSDAEHYDFQVMVGLATATAEIIDFRPDRLFYWLGYCLLNFGLEGVNPRISALMDALENEVISQMEDFDDTEEDKEP